MKDSKRKQKYQYEEMDGDIVYDAVKSTSIPGFKLLGGRIIDGIPPYGPMQPRKVIELGFLHEGTNFVQTLSFNYLKVKRNIERKDKHEQV